MIPIRKHVALGTLGSLVILGAIFLTQGPNAPFASQPPSSQAGAVGAIVQTPTPEVVVPTPDISPETQQSMLPFDPRDIVGEALRELEELEIEMPEDAEWEDEDSRLGEAE